jgi:hypothetical protein
VARGPGELDQPFVAHAKTRLGGGNFGGGSNLSGNHDAANVGFTVRSVNAPADGRP